ncbi:MAG: response regulator [Candidatus Magnetominusculus sp. LBB02]|nr:response regulator [Candidatus Magnetominusculus sp. LBB02]
MKVLIIEDNPLNMKLAAEILRRSGYDVVEAVNAADGIRLAKEDQPALILMDIQLPGVDGLTATKILKQDEETKHIKVVALTAFAMKGDEQRMREAGCDGYVSKPIRYKEFLETISSFIK